MSTTSLTIHVSRMKKIVLLVFTVLLGIDPRAQNYFSITPDFGGDEMAGMAYNVIPLEEHIKIIGLVPDSMVPGFSGGSWPILGSISYDGEYLGTEYLVDSGYSDPFIYFTRGIAFRNDTICYLYDRRDIGNELLDAYLVELDYRKGRVLRSKIVDDEITGSESFAPRAVAVGANGSLYLLNVNTEIQAPPILSVLDSSLNMIMQVLVPDYGRRNIPKYIEIDDAGSITIIGMSLGDATSVWWESKLYMQVLDSNLISTEFKLAQTEFDQSIILVDHYPIIKSQSGDWVIAAQRVVETTDCQGCTNGIPFVVRLSPNFTDVLSETKMFDGSESSSSPLYWASSITEVADGYVFCGSTDGSIGIETSGIIGKVGLNGDSLWLKHYIPVGWDSTRALWFDLKDIKTTPEGNIVACGRSFDRYNNIRVPWILHLDPDGCLEPGCNPVSTFNETESLDADLQVFPNPASTHCTIQVLSRDTYSDYQLRIIDSQGAVIKRPVITGRDMHFLLDLSQWPAGTYFAQLTNQTGAQLIRKFVVVN